MGPADRLERPLSRKETKAVTRSRLLDAALEILDGEGEAALTTINVTRRAGIAQSSFYVHFHDMEDLLHSLIDELTAQRRRNARAARRASRSSPGDVSAWRATFRVPIEHSLAHPQLFRLLVRSRHDRVSPLGAWSRAAAEESRRALIEDLHAAGMPCRTAEERRRAEMVAEGTMSLTESLILGHLDGRYPDIEEMIDVLTAFSMGYFPMLTENPRAIEIVESAWKARRAAGH
jgi:TetR/AcrR family transcriptional regulator, fatty acid biosynthesis regulator